MTGAQVHDSAATPPTTPEEWKDRIEELRIEFGELNEAHRKGQLTPAELDEWKELKSELILALTKYAETS